MRKIIIILDGLADQINKKTSLESAHTPNLDKLVKNSLAGLMYPIKNIAPESGEAQFVLLGNKLKDFPGRGPLEALGLGIKLKKNQIALRANFAKIKNNKITDRRTNPPSKKIFKKLNKIHKDIKIYSSIGYRAVIIIKNASPNIQNTDQAYQKIRKNNKLQLYSSAQKVKLKKLKAKGHPATCKKLNYFIEQAEKILKNKTILTRGAGKKPKKLKKFKDWSFIGDMPVEYGLSKLLGIKILKRQKNEIKQIINTKSNLYIQIKAPDRPGHRGDKKGKIRAIEKIDKQLKFLKNLKDIIVITADHATPYNLKRHSKDPVPYLIYNKPSNNINKFTEKACKRGKIIQGKDLMKLLY